MTLLLHTAAYRPLQPAAIFSLVGAADCRVYRIWPPAGSRREFNTENLHQIVFLQVELQDGVLDRSKHEPNVLRV